MLARLTDIPVEAQRVKAGFSYEESRPESYNGPQDALESGKQHRLPAHAGGGDDDERFVDAEYDDAFLRNCSAATEPCGHTFRHEAYFLSCR